MKSVFLDRDGTIIKDYPDDTWAKIKEPEFLPNSIEGLRMMYKSGYRFIIVTNQYLINEGIISEDDYQSINKLMVKRLEKEGVEILDIFHCPHRQMENCDCFKPKTGLIKKAMAKYQSIDLKRTIMIGDSQNDLLLARNVQIPAYIVGNKPMPSGHDYVRCRDLKEAAEKLLLSK